MGCILLAMKYHNHKKKEQPLMMDFINWKIILSIFIYNFIYIIFIMPKFLIALLALQLTIASCWWEVGHMTVAQIA